MTPGLHRAATDIALRAGRVMNYGDGLYGGVFVAGMYTAAFFESDPHKVVEAGLASIPAKSPYAMLIADLLKWYKQNPDDWRKTWKLIEDKWDKNDPCPERRAETASTSTPSSTAPTSRWACCTGRRISARRWRSPRAPARIPTATRRAPAASSA